MTVTVHAISFLLKLRSERLEEMLFRAKERHAKIKAIDDKIKLTVKHHYLQESRIRIKLLERYFILTYYFHYHFYLRNAIRIKNDFSGSYGGP